MFLRTNLNLSDTGLHTVVIKYKVVREGELGILFTLGICFIE